MRRICLLLIALLHMSAAVVADSYSNCTPSSCPSGYADNGIVCQGSQCTRNCTATVCGSSWTEAHSEQMHLSGVSDKEFYSTPTGYNSTNTSRCYRFHYDNSSLNTVWLNDGGTPACDTEMIGGFYDEDSSNSNPWFAGMSSHYLGYIGNSGSPKFDYLYRTMRAHELEDCYPDNPCDPDAERNYSIYCTPNLVACGSFTYCNTTCYQRVTKPFVYQAYLKRKSNEDGTLYNQSECDDLPDPSNNHYDVYFRVYSTPVTTQQINQNCTRPPDALSVNIVQRNATAGTDLLCNYTYHDWRNFSEQNSSYGWWRNGVNQNVNAKQLSKGNLSPTDSWFCRVTPSDGLLFGNQCQSANNVTILSTVANVTLYVQGNNTWNATGYYDAWNPVVFTSKLQAALDSCAADAQGYCNITLDFFSATNGTINASTLTVYYENISSDPGIELSGLNEFSGNGTERLFEFTIENTGAQALSNANWTFYPGNGDAVNSTIGINLSVGENASVYVAYNYSSVGLFTVTATARAAGLSSSQNITVEFPLQLRNLSTIYSSARERLFEFIIENTYGRPPPEVNFSVSRGDGSENSTYPLNLSAGESVSVYYYYNYSAAGNYTVNASATSGAYVSGENISVAVG